MVSLSFATKTTAMMTKEAIIDQISDTYAPLSAACKEQLAGHATLLPLHKNTLLVKEGEYADSTYYIVKGCARAYYLREGKDISDWFAFEGEFISSIVSFFTQRPSPHYIELLEDCILLELSRDHIEKVSGQFHDFEHLVRIVVTQTMLRLQEKISSLQFYTARQKYENILAIRPNITQRVALTHIASYLGISLETLSRIRNPRNRI